MIFFKTIQAYIPLDMYSILQTAAPKHQTWFTYLDSVNICGIKIV